MGRNRGLSDKKGRWNKFQRPTGSLRRLSDGPPLKPSRKEQKEPEAAPNGADSYVKPAGRAKEAAPVVAPAIRSPMLRQTLETLSLQPAPDSAGAIEAVEGALQRGNPVTLRMPVTTPAEARAERRGRAKERVKIARGALLADVRRGRPRRGEPPGPRPGSSRAVGALVGASHSAVLKWKAKPDADALDSLLEENRGGHNRRVSPELLTLLYYYVKARNDKAVHTDSGDIGRAVLLYETLMPALRTPAQLAKLKADPDRSPQPPSQPTIARICALLGISEQKLQPIKPQRLRSTLEEERRLFIFNVNHWPLRNILTLDETRGQLHEPPKRGLGITNSGGLHVEGDSKGPSGTFVANICAIR